MNHKVRGFYPFKGMFLWADIRVCERLLSQMNESRIMYYRGKIHALIEEFYNELAAIKSECEEYEKVLNSLAEEQQLIEDAVNEEHQDDLSRKRKIKKGGVDFVITEADNL